MTAGRTSGLLDQNVRDADSRAERVSSPSSGVPPELARAERFALIELDSRCWGPNGVVRMGVVGWRFARLKRTLIGRAAVVAVLEELPFICPVVVAVGSLIMIGITLFRDWPQ
jgi:hypothetical protein